MELLNWARGSGLQIATAVFVVGMVIRVFEIFLLGRKKDLSEKRQCSMGAGIRTIFTRSVPPKGMWSHLIPGYIWHIGFLLVLLFFTPHILFLKDSFNWYWPGFSNSAIDFITIISIAAMAFTLLIRITDPVRRMLSNFNDYFSWLVTILPLITGYMAFHRLGLEYTMMLAIHILSVDLLLVVFPFTKLTHAVTVFFSRWYNGEAFGRKGVQS
jgi:nitrate reductase gamma subunit